MKWIAFIAILGCGGSSPAPAPPASPRPEAPVVAPVGNPPPPPDLLGGPAPATGNRCDTVAASDLSIDGLVDDWQDTHVVARVGAASDGAVELRCGWDGSTLALAIDIKDDRVVRVKGGHEDHVTIALAAGGKPLSLAVYPANALARSKITKPAKVMAADSLQPKGFSIELAIPASAIPGFSVATVAFELDLVFHDSDAATGGDTQPLQIRQPLELSERKDLVDDFLASVKLRKADIKVDVMADLDPDRRGKERLVAGGTVIGILTDQYAFVSLPAATAADVKQVALIPLGARGHQIVSAVVRQSGNGGSRELLMLWTVWSGQLQPLAQIEVRKEMAGNVLEAGWKLVKGKQGPELWVEPKPAVGWTAETWNEVPAPDLDPIVLPWDPMRGGVAYTLTGAELARRDLPPPKPKKR
ncbi:MAG: hypothetical protein H0T89_26665 [Deltaproteobacteria bacterium]|nr:hypothetical protein [Deltaproteobacteria bacterium]MDQ3297592.1 hypothetical protein [Myxococcota bacterium]